VPKPSTDNEMMTVYSIWSIITFIVDPVLFGCGDFLRLNTPRCNLYIDDTSGRSMLGKVMRPDVERRIRVCKFSVQLLSCHI
jgi:hypothetical protein